MSLIAMPILAGLPPGSPVMRMKPTTPWAMMSKPGRSLYGPVCPKPLIEQ